MNIQLVLLHLSMIKGIGPGLVQRLFARFGPDRLQELYQFTESDLINVLGLTEIQAATLAVGLANTDQLHKECERAEKLGIKWLTIVDTNYPALLKEIYSPPTTLYYRGTAPNSYKKLLAIVGSRKAGYYAQTIIDQIVPKLVANDWAIVSGGAIGADSLAHYATLKAQGKTVAVVGSGLLRPYPAKNEKLFEDIIANGGTLMSPFNLQMEALPGNFPARNRIISGLSQGCLVVQAAKRSGAKITALFALEQGREVFAVPGSIIDELSVGCHQLIQQGAKLIMNADDILQEFGEQPTEQEQPVSTQSVQLQQQEIQPTSLQDRVLYQCKKPTALDELVDLTGSDLSSMHTLLFDMQLKGKIRQDLSGLWIAA